MLYADIATGEAKTKNQLIRENKNISLPRQWTAATLQALGVAAVTKTDPPTVGAYQVYEKDGIEEVNGEWREKWIVRDMFNEYSDADSNTVTVEDQKAEYDLRESNALATKERAKRDDLLKETDHYGLSDVTMSAEMTTYRQALRDVPQQAGFPSTITWPEKPE